MALTPEEISTMFTENGWTWKFKDGDKVPSGDDVEKFLEGLNMTLDERGGSMIESGRLLIKSNEEGNTDVYLHVGEIKEIIND